MEGNSCSGAVEVADSEITVTEETKSESAAAKQPNEDKISELDTQGDDGKQHAPSPNETESVVVYPESQKLTLQGSSSPAAVVSSDHSYTSERPGSGSNADVLSPAKAEAGGQSSSDNDSSPKVSKAMTNVVESSSALPENVTNPPSNQALTIPKNSENSNGEGLGNVGRNTGLGRSPTTGKSQVNASVCSKRSLGVLEVQNSRKSSAEKVSHSANKVKLPSATSVVAKYFLAKKRDWEPGEVVDVIREDPATIDITIDDEEKTDDSTDDLTDYPQSEIASDAQSEAEEVDVERLNESDSSEEDDEEEEHVDIETVEELSEKINIARLKARAIHVTTTKPKCQVHNPFPKKEDEKPVKKGGSGRRQNEMDSFTHYRETHTANERRRRNEMRDLFEKLKKTLGLNNLPKVSKFYILKQASEEIDSLTDQADQLLVQKSILTRKRDSLIRKVSILSGKTEEVVLKKLEYIYAKQKAMEAQKKKMVPVAISDEVPKHSPPPEMSQTTEAVSSSLSSEGAGNTKRDKPLILRRKRPADDAPSPTEPLPSVQTSAPSVPVATASLLMTHQGQVITLKTPLVGGNLSSIPAAILQTDEKAQGGSSEGNTKPGRTALTIQLQGSVPVRVKRVFSSSLTTSSIPVAVSTVTQSAASSPAPPTTVAASESSSARTESENSFMMPKIINVTSLASEELTHSSTVERDDAGRSLDATPQPLTQEQSSTQLDSEAAEGTSVKNCLTDGAVQQLIRSGTEAGIVQGLNQGEELKEGSERILPQILSVTNMGANLAPTSVTKATTLAQKSKAKEPGEVLDTEKPSSDKLQGKGCGEGGSEVEQLKKRAKDICLEVPRDLLTSMDEDDSTDETLTTLLNEIAFLNQQLNSDGPSLSTLPGPLTANFTEGESQQGLSSDVNLDIERMENATSFQFGELGFKEIAEEKDSNSMSPLLLQLEEEELNLARSQSNESSAETDILKIVIGTENADLPPRLVAEMDKNSSGSPLAEGLSPSALPALQIKSASGQSSTDAGTSWRPMPKLALMGMKSSGKMPSPPSSIDQEPQLTKPLPPLASIATKPENCERTCATELKK